MVSTLTTFFTVVLALSLAAERVVEVLKGFLPNFWLFKPSADPTTEKRRCAALRCVSGACGGAAALCSKVDLLTFLHDPAGASTTPPSPQSHQHELAAFFIAALFTSAGSAFWNHALDILKAFKVQQERAALAALAETDAAGNITSHTNSLA